MVVLIAVSVTGLLACDLAQGGLDFPGFGGFSSVSWAWALMDGGGGEGFELFNIFVLPALLATALAILCVSWTPSKTARLLGRWLLALAVLLLIQTPMALVGHVIFQSLFAARDGWLLPRIVFLAVLTVLRLVACLAMVVGAMRFLATRREVHAVAVDFADTDSADLRNGRAPIPMSLRAPVFLGLAATAGLLIGVVTAFYDVHQAVQLRSPSGPYIGDTSIGPGIWGVLKYGAQDVASATSTDPSALAVPILLLLSVIVLRRLPLRKGVAAAARLLAGFAAIELLLMPTFVIATVQVNAGLSSGAWVDFVAWSAARVLVCIAALLGALSILSKQPKVSTLKADGDVLATVPNPDLGVTLDDASFSSDGTAMSTLLGWTATLGLLAGIGVVIYDLVHSQSAIIGNFGTGPLTSDVARGALSELAIGQSGDFVFLFGPLLLVLAIYLRRRQVAPSPSDVVVRRWLLSVAVADWIVTCTYVAVSFEWSSGFFLVSFVGWGLVRLLVCFAAVAYALELPSGVERGTSGRYLSSRMRHERLRRSVQPPLSRAG
jgi:hypothetical protein